MISRIVGGQPLPQTEASIRDPETDAILPIGQVGEICARGYGVMLGYHDRPEATAQAIDEHGWLHTGDLGTMDSRGVIRITGRIKDMIIRGGENHFPVEIKMHCWSTRASQKWPSWGSRPKVG
ncbi:MAG: hypothetical protein CM1200mP41_16690 [Gammaproteobacteria bacterium]|nr:MAG: hypothetical protein CM1200mP41_16690 [Gammaproteobacteria bacterium]